MSSFLTYAQNDDYLKLSNFSIDHGSFSRVGIPLQILNPKSYSKAHPNRTVYDRIPTSSAFEASLVSTIIPLCSLFVAVIPCYQIFNTIKSFDMNDPEIHFLSESRLPPSKLQSKKLRSPYRFLSVHLFQHIIWMLF